MNAALLCLTLIGAYPVAGPGYVPGPSHWHADVQSPQRFYPTEFNLIAESRRNDLLGDCNLPDKGPTIYVDYYYANWCVDCDTSTEVAKSLFRDGYNVLINDAGTKFGAQWARTKHVTSVPFWIISGDGKELLRTNDSQKVLAWLKQNKPNAASQRMSAVYGPDGRAYGPQGQRVYYANPNQQRGCHPGRYVSAPVRWLWRPFRGLFRRGRC